MEDKLLANFEIGNNKQISGVYNENNANKKFTLWSKSYIAIPNHSNIYGTTSSNEPVSLIDCLASDGYESRNGDRTYKSEVYSHILVVGEEHIVPDEVNIESISIEIANPSKLLMDLRSFGFINFPTSGLISELNKQDYSPRFEADKNPLIAYFNGDFEIFSCKVPFGDVSAENLITYGSIGLPTGVSISNTITVKIQFHTCMNLSDSLNKLVDLTRFLRLIAGEGLLFKNISIKKVKCDDRLKVFHDSYDWGKESDSALYSTPLLNIQAKEFNSILQEWFKKPDRNVVRSNFYNTYFRGIYSSDRLITSANMFDIFPEEAVNKKVIPTDLDSILKSLKQSIKAELKEYDEEKQKLLQSIGLLTRKSLKDRIDERLALLDNNLFDLEIEKVVEIISYGVKSRNYFVHGSEVKDLTVNQLYEYQGLFIQCFEYVYAMSELIECGWQPEENPMFFSQHRLGGMKREIELGYDRLMKSIEYNKRARLTGLSQC